MSKQSVGDKADTGGPATRQERASELMHKAREALTLAQCENDPLMIARLRHWAQLLMDAAVTIFMEGDDES